MGSYYLPIDAYGLSLAVLRYLVGFKSVSVRKYARRSDPDTVTINAPEAIASSSGKQQSHFGSARSRHATDTDQAYTDRKDRTYVTFHPSPNCFAPSLTLFRDIPSNSSFSQNMKTDRGAAVSLRLSNLHNNRK